MGFTLSTQASYLLCFIVIAAYAVVSYLKKAPAQLSDAILLILATTSIPPCVRVITIFYRYNSESHPIKEIGNSEQSYIMIGAFAVIWLSCNEIFKKFNDKFNKK